MFFISVHNTLKVILYYVLQNTWRQANQFIRQKIDKKSTNPSPIGRKVSTVACSYQVTDYFLYNTNFKAPDIAKYIKL